MIRTDRSRFLKGQQQCMRARWFEYEFDGTGIRPKSQAIPLTSGSLVHGILAEVLVGAKVLGMLPDPGFVRAAVHKHVGTYRRLCSARGFSETASADVKFVIDEQATLAEGLVWAFYRTLLPFLLETWEIVEVETEHEWVIGCDCGLGDGIAGAADHQGRGCSGVVLMIRPDFVLRHREHRHLASWDLKTTGYELDAREYAQSPQMAQQCLGPEKDLGEPVRQYHVIGLQKGKRDYHTKAEREAGGLKKQYSSLCYGNYKVADPPFDKEEKWDCGWAVPRGYERVPIWECFFSQKPAGMSNSEFWVTQVMPQQAAAAALTMIGPFERPDWMVGSYLNQVFCDAKRAAEAREMLAAEPDRKQEILDAYFPQSWDCYPFRHECEFLTLCKGHAGAADSPLEAGAFVRRVPHHDAEKVALEGAGFTFAEEEAADDGE